MPHPIDSFAKRNLTPHSEFIHERINLKYLSREQTGDRELVKQVSRLEDECDERHKAIACSATYTRTLIDMLNNSSGRGSLLIDVLAPRRSAEERISEPRMSLVEFLTYVSSCCSTWFGFSILYLTSFAASLPRRLWHQRQKRRSNQSDIRWLTRGPWFSPGNTALTFNGKSSIPGRLTPSDRGLRN